MGLTAGKGRSLFVTNFCYNFAAIHGVHLRLFPRLGIVRNHASMFGGFMLAFAGIYFQVYGAKYLLVTLPLFIVILSIRSLL